MKLAFVLLVALFLVALVCADTPGSGSIAGSSGKGHRSSSSSSGRSNRNRGSGSSGNSGKRGSSSSNNNNQEFVSSSNDNNNDNNDYNTNDFNSNDDNDNVGGEYESSGSNNNNNNKHSSSSNNDYNNKQSSGGSSSSSANLASVIPEPQPVSQSLNDVYGANTETLLNLKFGPQFYQWNPRRNSSLFRWSTVAGTDLPSDNAVIQLVNGNGEAANGPYASKSNNAYQNSEDSYAKIITLPFGSEAYEEGFIESIDNYTVGNSQRIFFRMLFSCQTVGTEDNPFPSYHVTYSQDDPRLGECAFSVETTPDANSAIILYFAATNQGVWAVYETASSISKRRVGARERYDSLVDAGIEYDRRTNTATFYLNGYKVWTVNAVGTVPPNDGYTHNDVGDTSGTTVTPISAFQVVFGTQKCLDESNPWNSSDTTRLVRIKAANSPYYGSGATFYDADKSRENLVWGQGATMSVYKLKIWRAQSVAPKPTVLPGVYGASAPAFQSNNNNNNNNNEYNNNNDYMSSGGGNSEVFNF